MKAGMIIYTTSRASKFIFLFKQELEVKYRMSEKDISQGINLVKLAALRL
jgi:hypothetical protein